MKNKITKNIFLLCFLFSSFLTKCGEKINTKERYENDKLKQQILYAPHREKYCSNAAETRNTKKKCVFCMLSQDTNDKENLLVTRFKYYNLFLNLYPYQKGHMLVVPKKHLKNLQELSREEKIELMEILSFAPEIIKKTLGASGINIGINLEKISGATIPNHLHIHLVPRYESELFGFIETAGRTYVIQYDMSKLYDLLKKDFDKLKDLFYNNKSL